MTPTPTKEAVGHTAGRLLVLYSGQELELHRADKVADVTAKTRLMRMKRTPANALFLTSIAAHSDMLTALEAAEVLYQNGILATPSDQIDRVHAMRRAALSRAKGE